MLYFHYILNYFKYFRKYAKLSQDKLIIKYGADIDKVEVFIF